MIKVYLYYKKSQVKKVVISDEGTISITLDPKFVVFRNGRPIAVFNPISNMLLPLHPEYTIIVNK